MVVREEFTLGNRIAHAKVLRQEGAWHFSRAGKDECGQSSEFKLAIGL